jgi:hypothetical protein
MYAWRNDSGALPLRLKQAGRTSHQILIKLFEWSSSFQITKGLFYVKLLYLKKRQQFYQYVS